MRYSMTVALSVEQPEASCLGFRANDRGMQITSESGTRMYHVGLVFRNGHFYSGFILFCPFL
jgi:hypothetical protein